MASIENRDSLHVFLKDTPRIWGEIIAARAALRVLPITTKFLSSEFQAEEQEPPIMTALRANFVTVAALLYPNSSTLTAARQADVSASVYADAANAAAKVTNTSKAAVYAATAAAAYAANTAVIGDNVAAAAAYAANAAAYAATEAAADEDFWRSVSDDWDYLRTIGHSQKAILLFLKPLWHEKFNSNISKIWLEFTRSSFSSEKLFHPWIQWYEAITTFDRNSPAYFLFSDDLTIKISTQTNKWWERSALDVNTDIAHWLAEDQSIASSPPADDLSVQLTKALDQLPGQKPAPYQFDWRDGRMEVLPPDALPEDGGLAQDYLDEAREKAAIVLADLSGNNIRPDIHQKAQKLQDVLVERAVDLRPARVDSRTITIEKLVGELKHSPDSADLPPHVLRDLDDLAETARRLCRRLPGLWKDEVEVFANSLTPNSAAKLLTKLNALHDGIRNAEIIGPDVVAAFDALADECAEAADEFLKKFRTAMFGVTVRNFLDALVHSGKNVSSIFADELIRLSKEVRGVLRSEFVKLVAQGIIIGGVSITGCAALYIMNVGPIREIARSFPMLERICNFLDMIAPGKTAAAPPTVPPPVSPAAPPRAARPQSDKGPTRPA